MLKCYSGYKPLVNPLEKPDKKSRASSSSSLLAATKPPFFTQNPKSPKIRPFPLRLVAVRSHWCRKTLSTLTRPLPPGKKSKNLLILSLRFNPSDFRHFFRPRIPVIFQNGSFFPPIDLELFMDICFDYFSLFLNFFPF